jgi:REP element-mobilizing transposase RayT
LRALSTLFAVEVAAYAIMSNHWHVVLRNRPDWVAEWSDDEAARRWLLLFPSDRAAEGSPPPPSLSAISLITANPERLAEIRRRLSSVSWFMRCVNEYIARRANQEDHDHGRFWSGRFHCQALRNDSAVLACMAYVDLNPVRAKAAMTPEQSEYTSVYDRIKARRTETPESWLCPIGEGEDGRNGGILAMSLDQYLSLVDWSGRQARADKPGAIPAELANILDRLNIDRDRWDAAVTGQGRFFRRVVGRLESLWGAARRMGTQWRVGSERGRLAMSLS